MRRMDEKGVSPVIGVILMVAITVILAAVIASFVFGMGSSVKRTYNVAFTATKVNTTTISITFQGGPDVAYVSQCNVTKNNDAVTEVSWTNSDIGKTKTVSVTSGDVVNVVCTFNDGTKQVVMSYTVP